MSKLPVSVCIIARDEEKNIDRCLSSLVPYGFEIVLVDTGSQDRTREIAAKYTERIFDFKWVDDFSAARNYSLEMASNDWIFMIDCDEWLESVNLGEMEYFYKKCPQDIGLISRNNLSETAGISQVFTDNTDRLFSRKVFRYEGRIHEQLKPKFPVNSQQYLLNITIGHTGYTLSPQEKLEKAKRNLELLFKQMEEEPGNPYVYFQIGKAFSSIDDYGKSCLFYEKALSFHPSPDLDYVCNMVVNYGCNLLELGEKEKALSVFQGIYNEFSYSADFVYTMGLVYYENHLYEEALDEFQKALTFDSCNTSGITSYMSYYQIGLILKLAGEPEMAAKYFRECGGFPPALAELKALGEL